MMTLASNRSSHHAATESTPLLVPPEGAAVIDHHALAQKELQRIRVPTPFPSPFPHRAAAARNGEVRVTVDSPSNSISSSSSSSMATEKQQESDAKGEKLSSLETRRSRCQEHCQLLLWGLGGLAVIGLFLLIATVIYEILPKLLPKKCNARLTKPCPDGSIVYWSDGL